MAGFLDNRAIELPCGKCGRKTKKTIGWINSHQHFTCTRGTVTQLNTDKFKPGIAKANAAFKKLEDMIKSVGRRR
jgi:hypothetical protein